MLLAILFFVKYYESLKIRFLLFSSFSLGLATASKYFGFLTVPIILFWILPKLIRNKRKLVFLLLWIQIAAATFLIIQPRMWYDPIARLSESYSFNYKHMIKGHPIPITSIWGNGAWAGERCLPPYWTIVYWLIVRASAFEFVGVIALMATIIFFLKNSSDNKKLLIYIFLIPLIYFTIQPVKLPQ
jgi:hypothetical protein